MLCVACLSMAAKPACQYGDRCFRTNPQHLAAFSHPRDKQKQTDNETAASSSQHSSTAPSSRAKQASSSISDRKRAAADEAAATKDSKRRKTGKAAAASAAAGAVKQRQREDGEQSDEDVDGEFVYRSLSSLQPLSDEERRDYGARLLRHLFGLDFPGDLYDFLHFLILNHRQRDACKRCSGWSVQPACVTAVLTLLHPPSDSSSSVSASLHGLRFCGVYDWLLGRFDSVDRKKLKPWLHWRFFFDLPELMTLYTTVTARVEGRKREVKDDKEEEGNEEEDEDGWHCGYWRDAPDEPPPFLVSCSNFHPQCSVEGPTVFHAVHRHLLQIRNAAAKAYQGSAASSSSSSSSVSSSLSTSAASSDFLEEVDATLGRLLSAASARDYSLVSARGEAHPPLRDKAYLARKKRVLAPTATTLGFVCPYDPKTEVGFRPLPLTPAALTAMVERMQRCDDSGQPVDYSEWDGVQTLLTLAMDECDPGTVLLFNAEIFCLDRPNGVRVVEGEVSQGMRRAYEMMGGREGWRRCIGQQMKYRYRKTLSQLTVAKRAAASSRQQSTQ